jgi:hypothetical protein
VTADREETPRRGRIWLSAVLPLALLGALLTVIARTSPADRLRTEGAPPVERLAVERAVLRDDGIELSILNDGPDPVTIAQVIVDDAYWAFETKGSRTLRHLERTAILVPYPWVEGESHVVKLLTSTGATFEHAIAVAVRSPGAEAPVFAALALIGLYVGVIPVALGLLWHPVLSRLGRTGLDALLALTVGLLAFLLVEAVSEGIETAGKLPGSYQGIALLAACAAGAYLALEALGTWLRSRRARLKVQAPDLQGMPGGVLALLIAAGIGVHNFGEGLAIGAAFALGEAALGTLLIVGFTLHNTTEGLAIVAPLAKERPSVATLAKLGLIGGLPTIAGAWAGGLVYSPIVAVACLGIGAGAIAQVTGQVAGQITQGRSIAQPLASAPVLLGLLAGFAVMYVTGMLVG